ncbi:Protein ELF4-LIKE 3 [Capsicum annuum]|uniref:Protein ELF4-LIKE 3 n=3 Tax=Capsicum TaxID=4071 RepID=A0A2G2Y988_CAPAN|nr:Protein ELF4-LIKE 3 [Capsicum annuum]
MVVLLKSVHPERVPLEYDSWQFDLYSHAIKQHLMILDEYGSALKFFLGKVLTEMEDVTSNGIQVDHKVVQTLQRNFVQVQNILDQNRLLINEINQNHESTIPDNLTRNVGLIRELNNNIRRVVDLYADISSSVTISMEAFSGGESTNANQSDRRDGQKRIRSS